MNEIILAIDPTGWEVLFRGVYVGLMAAILILAAVLRTGTSRWWWFAGGLCGLVIVSSFTHGWSRIALLDLAVICAVGLVWLTGTEASRKAAKTYFVLMLVAMGCIAGGIALCAQENPGSAIVKLTVLCFVVGFGLKLAFAPFYSWLPKVAETANPLTTALIISVVDIAAFEELWLLRMESGWVFVDYITIWLGLAIFSMIGGAILALGQHDIKRMLAFSTIDDLGYLLLGVIVGTPLGMVGAALGAISHAVMKVLLFGAVAQAEKGLNHPLTLNDRGLAAKFPVSGFAFIIGALGMVGIPPLLGFSGRWRLYLTGLEFGGVPLLIAMVTATGLALLYYVRAIHQVWYGEPVQEVDQHEPKGFQWVLVILSVLVILTGIYPGLWIAQLP